MTGVIIALLFVVLLFRLLQLQMGLIGFPWISNELILVLLGPG